MSLRTTLDLLLQDWLKVDSLAAGRANAPAETSDPTCARMPEEAF